MNQQETEQNRSAKEAHSGELVRPKRPSYVMRVVIDTLGVTGARIGAVWLAVISLFAVFAPFLANSYPYRVEFKDGLVAYPLFRNLTPVDVSLPIILVLAVVLFFLKPIRAAVRGWWFIGLTLLTLTVCYTLVDTPPVHVYDEYRVLERQGEIVASVKAPIPYSPSDRMRDIAGSNSQAPSTEHWLGTEADGADVFSRMIWASRIAMSIGFISTGIALVIGVIVGGLMGYFSGVFDLIGMRLVEIFESIPQLYLLLTFVAFFDRNLYMMMAIIGFTSWSRYARFVRAEFLKLRKMDYVQATHALGLPLHSILFNHMLPNGIAPVLVTASFGIANAILAEAFLSFLGLGLVDKPSWGQMLSQAIGAAGGFVWWMAIFPGAAIFLTVFAYNLIGEALRDTIDPYTAKS